MQTQPVADPPHRRSARFGLGTALIAVLFIAALFAAYRVGYQRGRMLGPMVPTNASTTNIYSREYDISDIVTSEPDAELLLASLRESVEPDSWDVAGGYAEVTYDSNAGVFTVSQVWPGHVAVVTYLSHVREFASGRRDMAAILEVANRN